MAFSMAERISHVFRRLGVGAYPDLVARTDSISDAISLALALTGDPPELLDMEVPMDRETATDIATLAGPVQSWLTSMVTSPRLIEERLTWFWHDHFATAIQKVRIPYLLWRQHLSIRKHATGNFGELLHAISFDPAMLFYLDGIHNNVDEVNENFAREVMELHTMGAGNYTQDDIAEAARALTGWLVKIPFNAQMNRYLGDYQPWESIYISERHDQGLQTILGRTDSFAPSDVIDLLLEQDATRRFVARKLWVELAGTEPDEATLASLELAFSDYSIMALVEAIVANPAFVSEEAIRSKVRTPVERLVGVAQAFGSGEVDERLGYSLHGMAYLPFNPPSPAGYPRGRVLLGPHQMVHAFDLLAVARPDADWAVLDPLTQLGLIDVNVNTRAVVDGAPDQETAVALAVNSPEFALV